MSRRPPPHIRRAAAGQATVEFALAFLIFISLTFGVIDTSRALFDQHGLSRAAERIAHDLAVQYAASPSPINSSRAAVAMQDGHTVSDASFSTTAPTTVNNGVGYQELNNGSVYVCASPSLGQPEVIQVTVQGSFTPASSLFIGGRTIGLSESATALTYLGEENANGAHNLCPAH